MFRNKSLFDVVIVGAGIVGSMIARELSRFELKVALVDRADDIGAGASAANSAILHSGHDPKPGSLKARLNRRGNELWWQIAEELDVPHLACGSLIVALGPDQLPKLDELLRRGEANGISGLRILSRQETLEKEPLLNPQTSGALWTPTAGVIDPFRGTIAAAENAVMNGAEILLDTEVSGFLSEHGRVLGVMTSRGEIRANLVINAAGIQSDKLMHLAGDRPEFSLVARKGEYFIFDPAKIQVQNVLFPLPTAKGKGTLVTTTTHGNTMIGPNAQLIEQRSDTSNTAAGMDEILANARTLVPSLDARDIIASFAGIRATGIGADGDFVIEASGSISGLIHLSGIESPGYVAAPAIAEEVVKLVLDSGQTLRPRANWIPGRPRRPRFKELSHSERSDLIEKDSRYGRIVCRCELVTEGEVVAEIHGPIPARTYDALKRRCWLGTGRCQGGFDYSRVIDILSREVGEPMTSVTKKGECSRFLYRDTKEEDPSTEDAEGPASELPERELPEPELPQLFAASAEQGSKR
jgi:glycerol-3-phosphate dehydrogenase